MIEAQADDFAFFLGQLLDHLVEPAPQIQIVAAMGGTEAIGISPEADGAVRRGGLY